jgi:hypothetical protein
LSRAALASVVVAACVFCAPVARADGFSYEPPGTLVSGSGTGRVDLTVYAPGIRFPIEEGPAYANSQVWGHGGLEGGGGSQCDKANFSYPWHDNYCETRSWTMPLCKSGTGHQGQDVRASTCDKDVHWVVAVEDGTITSIGSYSVYLTAADGTRFDYLHMSRVQVEVGDKVKRGDRVGTVSNQFGTSSTTVHLHFNVYQNVAGVGYVYVPPYLSLVRAYEDLLGSGGDGGAGDAAPDAKGDAGVVPDVKPIADAGADAPDFELHAEASAEAGCACRAAPVHRGGGAALGALVSLAALVSRRGRRGRRVGALRARER